MSTMVEKGQLELLELVACLSDDELGSMAASAAHVEHGLTGPAELGEILRGCSELEEESRPALASLLSGLLYALIGSGQSTQVFLAELQQSVENAGFDRKLAPRLVRNLTEVFGIKKLYAGHKAFRLANENERVMTGTRIITDVRPVFGEDVFDGILGYIVAYTLNIQYQDMRGDGEFYVSLSSSDIDLIREAIVRADQKVELLSQSPEIAKSFLFGN